MPKDDRPPAMLLYFDDFVSDGKVEAMTTLEVGAYFLLLCKAWREDPPGSIPNDDRVLARWARLTPDEWAVCRVGVLAAFIVGTDDRWHQKRMRKEFAKLTAKLKEKSLAGKRAAAARWKHDECSTQCAGNADACPGDMRNDAISSSSSSSIINQPPSPQTPGETAPENPGLVAGGLDFWNVDSKAAARLALESCGYKRFEELITECRGNLQTPREIIAACDEFRANNGKLTSPGAIAEKLRKGIWPAEGVQSVDKALAKRTKDDEEKRRNAVESMRYRLVKSGETEASNWSPSDVIARVKELEARSP